MGNACVLKPAEEACLTALAFAALAQEAGLPAGALNLVTGLGEEAGAALSGASGRRPPLVHRLGRAPARWCRRRRRKNVVPVTLELGGKSPQLVFADADLDAALPFLVNAGIQNAGQTCSAASRILVERPIYDTRAVERMADALSSAARRPGRGRPRPRAADLRAPEGDRRALSRVSPAKTGFRSRPRAASCADAPEGGYYVGRLCSRGVASGAPAGAGGDLRPGAGGDPVRRRGRGHPHRQRHASTGWWRACGPATADASCAWRGRCAPAKCSSTITERAAASSCLSAASRRSGHGREKGFEALYGFSTLKTVAILHG